MLVVFIFLLISLIIEILGILQIIKKGQRGALNWSFFAICTIIASSAVSAAFNSFMPYYPTVLEAVKVNEFSDTFINLNFLFSFMKLLIVPSIFAFIFNLSKIKSKGLKILQYILITVNMTAFSLLAIILAAPVDTISVLSFPSFDIWFLSLIILSFCCLIYLTYKWIRSATLKRDRIQAVTITVAGMITFSSLVGILAFPYLYLEVLTFIGTLIFIIICNNYANQYNSFSFNISNLATYVYTSVKLPVLILDDTGVIVLCNTASESFFQKGAGQLNKLKLFNLFDFGDV